MKLFNYQFDGNTCIWAQIEECDVAELLVRGGFSAVPCGGEQTPDFTRGNCVVELKCIEEESLFSNGSLRYIANEKGLVKELMQAVATPGNDTHVTSTIQIKAEVFLTRADRLIRKAKHQLRAHRSQGRVTGVIVINNGSFSISGIRRRFATILQRKAVQTGVVDFIIYLDVFTLPDRKPRIDLNYRSCRESEDVHGELNRVVELLKGLPEYIEKTAKTQKVEPHTPPHITIKFSAP